MTTAACGNQVIVLHYYRYPCRSKSMACFLRPVTFTTLILLHAIAGCSSTPKRIRANVIQYFSVSKLMKEGMIIPHMKVDALLKMALPESTWIISPYQFVLYRLGDSRAVLLFISKHKRLIFGCPLPVDPICMDCFSVMQKEDIDRFPFLQYANAIARDSQLSKANPHLPSAPKTRTGRKPANKTTPRSPMSREADP